MTRWLSRASMAHTGPLGGPSRSSSLKARAYCRNREARSTSETRMSGLKLVVMSSSCHQIWGMPLTALCQLPVGAVGESFHRGLRPRREGLAGRGRRQDAVGAERAEIVAQSAI